MAKTMGRREKRWGHSVTPTLWGGAGLVLLLPLVAMQFTTEVAWTIADFVVFGGMLIGACGLYELTKWRMEGDKAYGLAVGTALTAAFLLIWMNLAVGIIGSEDHPANRMYWGVLTVGITGAGIGRFRPSGMARALIATALVQALVSGIALIAGYGRAFILSSFFIALWLASARLFWQAAAARGPRVSA